MPDESIVYVGDQQHVPYGPRPLAQVRVFSEAITRFLLVQGAKLVVVACNAASAAALDATAPDLSLDVIRRDGAGRQAGRREHT